MRANPITITVVAAVAMLAVGAPRIAAAQEKIRPAYVFAEIDVHDPAGFAQYSQRQGKLVAKYGGKFMVRGGKMVEINGALPKRFTVYVFDSVDKVNAWKDDPEQKELIPLRDKSSSFRSFAVEGCADCAPFKAN
jgi:uncharacterized protein (DUF1330 family)